METMEVILRKTRLQCLGYVHRMGDSETSRQALSWFPTDGKEDLEDLGRQIICRTAR